MDPPERLADSGMLGDPPGGHVSNHQDEDEKRDQAGFVRKGFQPFRPNYESAKCETGDGDGAEQRKHEGDRKSVV